MNKQAYTEDINGIIMGDMAPSIRGRLYYGDRPQGERVAGQSEQELIEAARIVKHHLIDECKDILLYVYPDDSQWQLRIYE